MNTDWVVLLSDQTQRFLLFICAMRWCFSFHDQHVRSVAVQRFQEMSDSELEEFLPQLVQVRRGVWKTHSWQPSDHTHTDTHTLSATMLYVLVFAHLTTLLLFDLLFIYLMCSWASAFHCFPVGSGHFCVPVTWLSTVNKMCVIAQTVNKFKSNLIIGK